MILEFYYDGQTTHIKRLASVTRERRLTCPGCGQQAAIRWAAYPKQESPPASVPCPRCGSSINAQE